MIISYDDFVRVDVRIGTVLSAAPTPGARRPAYLLEIDFGPGLGRKKASAQVTELYAPEQLVGRQVAAVVNFPPKQIARAISERPAPTSPAKPNTSPCATPNERLCFG